MHAGDPRQLRFEMKDGAKVRIVRIEISEGAAQEREEFRLMVIRLGANLDQLDKIRGGLCSPEIFSNSAERIFQHDLSQGMEVRFPAAHDLNFRFEKEIEFAGERTFRAPGATRDGLNAA